MSFYSWSYKTDQNLVGCSICGLCRGDSGECLTFIDDLSLLGRNVPSRRRRWCAVVMKSLDSKGWVMQLKKHLQPGPRACRSPSAVPGPAGSHCSRWSCSSSKRKAARGPKCDQCIINYTFVCFLSSTNHLAWCQCCSWLLVGWSCVSWATLVSGGRVGHCLLTGRSCEGIGSWGCNNCASKVPLIHSELTTCCFLHLARLPYCFPFVAFECFLSLFQRLECFK